MITELTRRDLITLFNTYDPAPLVSFIDEVNGYRRQTGICWWGRLDGDVEFLSRLYDLRKLPSSDPRFKNAEEDIQQHRQNNLDWDDDWVFTDERFELATSDDKLLRFLAETLHPGVRADRTEVDQIRSALNRILRPDHVEIQQVSSMSGRPLFAGGPATPRNIQPDTIRDAIGQAIRHAFSAGQVASYCDELHMPPLPAGSNANPQANKAAYLVERLAPCSMSELIQFARTVMDRSADLGLGELLAEIDWAGTVGVPTAPKNIIFAADGPKPDIVLVDAVDNDIQIVRNAEFCLVYDRPINPDAGVTFQMLLDWWIAEHSQEEGSTAANELYRRLCRGQNEPERRIFAAYAAILSRHAFSLPALIPQVYLHYDPATVRERSSKSGGRLERQRMDFLMLLPGRHRIVVELDGQQHYSDDHGPSPRLYAEMMAEDRRLRLAGYEVYRFGGFEFTDATAGGAVALDFFERLLQRHGLLPP